MGPYNKRQHQYITNMKMRLQTHHQNIVTLPVLLLAAFAFSTATAAGAQLQGRHVNTRDYHCPDDGNVFPFLRWLRDSVSQTVFGPSARRASLKDVTPAAALPARYQNDVVVRFNVTNSEEEGALSKAVNQLIMDVWAFTPDFVDIRLDKRDVPSLLSLLPSSLQPTVLIPDMAVAVSNTFPSKSTNKVWPDPSPTEKARTSRLDGISDLFFQEYQPLAVSGTPPRQVVISPELTIPTRSSIGGCASSSPCSQLSSA